MKKATIIFVMLLTIISIQAQQRLSVEDMHERKWKFMVEKMQLSSSVAEKMQPLFIEYESAVWKIMEQNKDAYRKFNQDKRSNSNPDYGQMNERFVNSEMQKAQLMKNYYNKLKKHLSAEQIFNYFETERSFRKELMRDFQGKGRRQQQP